MLVFPFLLAYPSFLAYPPARAEAAPYGLPDKYGSMIDCGDDLLTEIDRRYFLTVPVNHGLPNKDR